MKIEVKSRQAQNYQILDKLNEQNLRFEIKKNYIEVLEQIDNEKLLKIIEVLELLGVEVIRERKKYIVQNMSCAACVRTVENTLLDSPGVLQTQVNFANSIAYIEYIPGTFNFQTTKNDLNDLSYNIIEDKDKQIVDENEIKETKKLAKNTIITGLLTIPVVIAGMFFHSNKNLQIVSFAFTTFIIFWSGYRFFKSAFLLAKKFQSNMYTLISLGVFFSYLVSIFSLFFANKINELHQHIYFEASAVIIFFSLLGRYIEKKATQSTKTAIKDLYKLKINKVTRLVNNKTELVEVEQIEKDDILVNKLGEIIAVDGVVVQGSSYVDERTLTGE